MVPIYGVGELTLGVGLGRLTLLECGRYCLPGFMFLVMQVWQLLIMRGVLSGICEAV